MFRFFTHKNLEGKYIAIDKESIRQFNWSDISDIADNSVGEGFYTEDGLLVVAGEHSDKGILEVSDSELLTDLVRCVAAMELEEIKFPVMIFSYDPDAVPSDDQLARYSSLIDEVFSSGCLPTSDAEELLYLEDCGLPVCE